MFDCVMPYAQRPQRPALHRRGVINIRNRKWEDDFSPIDPEGTAGLRGPHLLQGLPPPPLRLRRDDGRADRLAAQHRILPAAGMAWPASTSRPGISNPRKEAMVAKLEQKTVTHRGRIMRVRWPGLKILDRYIIGKIPENLLFRHRDDHRGGGDLRLCGEDRRLHGAEGAGQGHRLRLLLQLRTLLHQPVQRPVHLHRRDLLHLEDGLPDRDHRHALRAA